ncbi:MAG TPA: 1-acyl-sn-glycerol-3-phosphate acyltransferase [Bacteroidales bacterium]|nr:1-acyl-sn-glycerol-3-phosphate acyltransferase [Bacteroidales bacterium]
MEGLEVDVEQILYGKNPGLKRVVPGFVVRYLKRIVHQDEINATLREKGHLKDFEFNEAILEMMGITYHAYGAESLPAEGRFIFVSNHPLGGLDGMVFIKELSAHYPSVRFPVNDILLYLKNYSGIFVPVNKHGAQGREAARLIEEAYASDSQMLYFPAGICSRRNKGIIKDLQWQKSFVAKAVQYNRDVIPCYFSGRNSSFFYNLASLRSKLGIKANIEMLYLADEMFRQKGKDIDLVFGERIPWQTFDKSKSQLDWAEWVRNKTYELSLRLGKGVH